MIFTGATTIVGDGCFYAWYGCPKHGGPADGHIVPGKVSSKIVTLNSNTGRQYSQW